MENKIGRFYLLQTLLGFRISVAACCCILYFINLYTLIKTNVCFCVRHGPTTGLIHGQVFGKWSVIFGETIELLQMPDLAGNSIPNDPST